MNLLRYEFCSGPNDSINGMIRNLVREIRYNRSNVSIDEFTAAMPGLRNIESTLQRLDTTVGQPKIDYIQKIMDELDQEQEDEQNIEDDLNQASVATIKAFFDDDFEFENLSYTTGKADHFHWLNFKGYTDERSVDINLVIIREVFRSICNKYNYIFIDLS